MTGKFAKETPTLLENIENLIDIALRNVNTAMPGEIVSYEPSLNTAVIKPAFTRTYTDGTIVEIPNLEDVPIAFPRSGTAAITFPLKAGDSVLLVFCQRNIEQWKLFGGTVTPDTRKFNLSDAVAIPGVYSASNPIPIEPDKFAMRNLFSKIFLSQNGDIEIEGLLGRIKVGKDGKISIGNGTIELLDLIDRLISAISAMTVTTALGPSGPPINIADFLAIQTELAAIKE
jgi:hypothetical protein